MEVVTAKNPEHVLGNCTQCKKTVKEQGYECTECHEVLHEGCAFMQIPMVSELLIKRISTEIDTESDPDAPSVACEHPVLT
eukprot:UN12278